MISIQQGSVIAGKYRLERPLAQGGMGAVWVARHLQLDIPVAIKFMLDAQAASPQARARFDREAKASARLQSPHVVQVHDYGIEQDTPYLVMELLQGEDLGARLQREGRLSLAATASLVQQTAKALRIAHEQGLVHRDLKPGNLFYARAHDEETVKILDFGIAKDTAHILSGQATKTGTLIGSPHYMSPEQARSVKELDHRSDLWSLGVILFRCVTGRLPFPGEEIAEVLVQICADPIPIPSQIARDLGPDVDRFFERALARDVDHRFQSAHDLAEAFTALAAPHPAAISYPSYPGAGPVPSPRPPLASYPSHPGPAPAPPPPFSPAPAPVHAITANVYPTHPGPSGPFPQPASYATPRRGVPPIAIAAALFGSLTFLAVVALIAGKLLFSDPSPRPVPPRPVTLPTTTSPDPYASLPASTALPSRTSTAIPPRPAGACAIAPCCGGTACDAVNQNATGSICATRADRCAPCKSGRACVPGACRDHLDLNRPFRLRLARVEPAPPSDAKICIRRTGAGPPVCTRAGDAAEAPGAAPSRGHVTRLSVTTADFQKGGGLDITLTDANGALVTAREGAVIDFPVKISALCVGLDFQLPGARITFYLDDP